MIAENALVQSDCMILKCIISIKSSVNDLCVDFLQIVWDLWNLQIDHAPLVWYGRTYPDMLKVLRKS